MAPHLYDHDLEAATLGGMLRDPGTVSEARAAGLTASAFTRSEHTAVARALLALDAAALAGGVLVPVTVALDRAGELALVNSAGGLAQLVAVGFDSTNVRAAVARLVALARAREAHALLAAAAQRVASDPDALVAALADVARAVERLDTSGRSRFAGAAISAAELAEQELAPPRSLLGDGVLAAGGFGILYGKPSTGKSWLALMLLRALARGEPWLGIATPGEGARVGLLQLELGAYRAQARLRALGVGPHERDANVRLLLRPRLRGIVDLTRPDDLAELRTWVCDDGLDLVAIDAFSRSHTAPEIDGERIGMVLAGLDALRHETGCAVLLIHHERKSQRDDGADSDLDALRGHSRLQSDPTLLARVVNARGLRCVRFPKVSEGPTPEPVWLRADEDGVPHVVASPDTVADANRERVVRFVTDAGRPVTRAEVEAATGLSASAVKRHLAALIEQGAFAQHGTNRAATYGPAHQPTPAHDEPRAGASPQLFNGLDHFAAQPAQPSGRRPAHRPAPAPPKGGGAGGPLSGAGSAGPNGEAA
jgi:hypothetical protein